MERPRYWVHADTHDRRQLDLAGRGVGPAGARGLAMLTNLESLRLGWCHIGTEVGAAGWAMCRGMC
jgi:hypothetical protein